MMLHECITKCQADPRYLAVSMEGNLFEVSRTGAIFALIDGKRRYARLRAADLLSQTWRVFTNAQLLDAEFMKAQG